MTCNSALGSPQERVLLNPDLLHNILQKIARPLSSQLQPCENDKALARAARVCKAFTEPALRILWRSLPGLLPLFQVLPTFSKVPTNSQYVLTGRIAPEHWQRFLEYAHRVRELRYDSSDDGLVSKSAAFVHVMHRLHCERCHVLPRIRTLFYIFADLQRTSLLPLLSPTLESLELYCTNITETGAWSDVAQGTSLDLVLGAVCTSCPSLGELKLRFLRSSLPLQTVAAGLKNLRTLELPDSVGIADEGALQALAALPQLYALHDLHLKLPSRRTTPTLSVSGFRSLKELSVVGDASNVSRFLPCVMSALDKFEIMSFGLLSPWLPAYPAISSNLLYVRELVIRHAPRRPSARRGEEDVSEIELVELLQPLLQLRNVESFCLALRTVGLVGDDDMFETVAQAWPRLTLFWLDAEPFLSTPTFLTLSAFAMHCPSLRTLVLPHVDHAALQFIMYGFKAEKPQTALRRLSFCVAGGLRVDDARSAAKLVVGIFPMLDVLASAVLPQRVHMFSDESQADPTAQLKEAHRQDGAILWAMVLEEVQKLQLGETP